MSRFIKFFIGEKKHLVKLGFALLFFFGGAELLLNYWERPLLTMVFILILGYLPFLKFSSFLLDTYYKVEVDFSKKRKTFLLISALVTGSLMSFLYANMPNLYHRITIIPSVLAGNELEILEIKIASDPLDFLAFSMKKGWHIEGTSLYASADAEPLTLSFYHAVYTPVDILVSGSEYGEISFVLDKKKEMVNLVEIDGHTKLSLHTRYRNIPNLVFVSFFFLSQIVFWSSLILSVLLLQERGASEIKHDAEFLFADHKKNLIVLMGISIVLHTINALATPLIVGGDSDTYVDGALSLLKFGSLKYAPTVGGPAWIFFFAPIFLFFGRNPWGTKFVLHLIAVLCVPLAYKLGWELSQNKKISFSSGIMILFTPDLFYYANYVWADLINLFLGLFFLVLLLSAIRKGTTRAAFYLMLMGAVASLFRLENILLLFVGFVFLAIEIVKDFRETGDKKSLNKGISLVFFLILAVLPFWEWSFYKANYSEYDGVKNYAGEVFYTGWVYYGEASNFDISNPDSEAVQKIDEIITMYPASTTDKKGVRTGWQIYPSLLKYGYNPEEAMALLTQAAWDSILGDLPNALELVYRKKIPDSLEPDLSYHPTFPITGEKELENSLYFDAEKLSLPLIIKLQRKVNVFAEFFFLYVYKYFVYLMVAALFFSAYRRPVNVWLPVIFIVLLRYSVTNLMALTGWRYTLVSLVPWLVISVVFLASIYRGVGSLYSGKSYPKIKSI